MSSDGRYLKKLEDLKDKSARRLHAKVVRALKEMEEEVGLDGVISNDVLDRLLHDKVLHADELVQVFTSHRGKSRHV
jgi:hypothetical protein